ncbi:nucleotidyltransferase family protein [Pontibacter arcticus]|uniref:Nucleotidyltransferase family protein n=1 Tax=Pontibacter arcticus TaxID=2080288 RepID=A0A364RC02_9BACT|nr:nucleotidyltransferase family protein [Pontibacter arcticus]RAU81858.1 nucleotidyltransferase family protein [Pontibacter arcticus]
MTGLVILAAGASTRLGKPKQNLYFEGATLLQRAVKTALISVCDPIIVVLSPDASYTLPEDKTKTVTIVRNSEWQEGMASSIRIGLLTLLEASSEITSSIFMVCDQPFVEAALLHNIVQTKTESGKGIVASKYKDTLGTPVLFDKRYFPELLALQGQEGAKRLIAKYKEDVAAVDFPLGYVDIDTSDDYNALIKPENDTF